MSARWPLRRATHTALALVASASLAVNLSCAAAPALPPMEQSSVVELKSPATVVVRHTAGETSFRDVLTVYGVITTADETSLQIDVRQLADGRGIRVPHGVGGIATLSRSDIRRIVESEPESRQRVPVMALVVIPVFLAASAMVLVFIYKGWTILF